MKSIGNSGLGKTKGILAATLPERNPLPPLGYPHTPCRRPLFARGNDGSPSHAQPGQANQDEAKLRLKGSRCEALGSAGLEKLKGGTISNDMSQAQRGETRRRCAHAAYRPTLVRASSKANIS